MSKMQLKSAVLGGVFSVMLLSIQTSIAQGQFSAISKADLSITMNDNHGNALARCPKALFGSMATCTPMCSLFLGCVVASVTVTNNSSSTVTNVHASSSSANFSFVTQDSSQCSSVPPNGGTCTLYFDRAFVAPVDFSVDCIGVSGTNTGTSYFNLDSSCS